MAADLSPLPSWADAGYATFLVGAALCLFFLMSTYSPGTRVRLLLDGVLAAAALLGAAWVIALNVLYSARAVDPLPLGPHWFIRRHRAHHDCRTDPRSCAHGQTTAAVDVNRRSGVHRGLGHRLRLPGRGGRLPSAAGHHHRVGRGASWVSASPLSSSTRRPAANRTRWHRCLPEPLCGCRTYRC